MLNSAIAGILLLGNSLLEIHLKLPSKWICKAEWLCALWQLLISPRVWEAKKITNVHFATRQPLVNAVVCLSLKRSRNRKRWRKVRKQRLKKGDGASGLSRCCRHWIDIFITTIPSRSARWRHRLCHIAANKPLPSSTHFSCWKRLKQSTFVRTCPMVTF